ncbi:MAG: Lrp/AsnC family transcriptional regulator [Chloroflexi bacterium]|nr:Lrp/AsnC family transcriptional regulator [Chloroflexota bacterium]
MSTTKSFEKVEQELLNLIQSEFPLDEKPYKVIADRLGTSEKHILELMTDLKKRNVVRQVSAIFDTRRLGYKSSLVAMRFNDDELDAGAQIINQHPGVSHNYGRTGHFNLWFTVAVAPGVSLEETVEQMGKETNAIAWRLLPTKQFFKIGVNFDMVNKRSNATENYAAPETGKNVGSDVDADWNKAQPVSERDIEVIREMQEDLEAVSRPFDAMAERLGMSVQEMFDYSDDMVKRKLMRRFSAVLYHRRAGFSANAMVVWNVPAERSQEVGDLMAMSSHVTHCYERPTYDDWKYSHYTMIHATTEDECEEIAVEIARQIGIDDRQLVFSTREYKKTRVRYFV